MKTIFALALAVCFIAAPAAMAGNLSTHDSDYLFRQTNVAATTLSTEEMDSTEGQLSVSLGLNVDASGELAAAGGLVGTLLGAVPALPGLPL